MGNNIIFQMFLEIRKRNKFIFRSPILGLIAMGKVKYKTCPLVCELVSETLEGIKIPPG